MSFNCDDSSDAGLSRRLFFVWMICYNDTKPTAKGVEEYEGVSKNDGWRRFAAADADRKQLAVGI